MNQTFLAFIRGINVGGNNIIKMADLREALTDDGFENVKTYIQSGNVVFSSKNKDTEKHRQSLQKSLQKHFGVTTKVVTFSAKQWQDIVNKAPKVWGKNPEWKHNILIALDPKRVKAVLTEVGELKHELEWAEAGKGVIYQSVSRDGFSRSRYSKLPSLPAYQEVTIRNFNTANKLLTLLEDS